MRDKYCKAKVCKLGLFRIEQSECILCGLCKQACAFDAVKETRRGFFIDRNYCTKCKSCYSVCPVNAVKIVKDRFARLEEEFHIQPEEMEIIERRSKMTLRDILHSKPPIIVTIHKNKTVRDAVHTMSEKNVSGIFVIDDNNKLASIFTERDIVRCSFNNIPLDETIEKIMRHDITTFDPSVDISSAINVASRKKIRHLPIVEGDSIAGMITFRDLVSYLLPEICYVADSIY